MPDEVWEPGELRVRLTFVTRSVSRAASIALCLSLAACSTSVVSPTVTLSVTAFTQPPIESCPLDRVEGCALYGLVLVEPSNVEDAIAEVDLFGGTALGLWRADAVCVPSTVVAPDEQDVPSRFAYVDAEQIRVRRLAAVNSGIAPPITGFLISEAYWNHWETQWGLMLEPGVEVVAVGAYLSMGGIGAIAAEANIGQILTLDSRRTDSLDPAYPGELLLADEEFPTGYLPDSAPPNC